ncbi:hypothetical protein DERF_009831 [Dermatophagoides farinae]|uniref:Uncharacterized protein n=1 Tax=Dermatophagoides farinae TaxID=6954 RepID=A0A922HXP5_DERFA|nr:hypothetical protein DERF_009765 [Dermatophagoides farinae]KAH9511363.1 hypothetical protein DERF_009831 [Dermatophagoides farinae]
MDDSRNNRAPLKQWLTPGQPPVPTPRPKLHQKKVLLLVHHELLESSQTITAEVLPTTGAIQIGN